MFVSGLTTVNPYFPVCGQHADCEHVVVSTLTVQHVVVSTLTVQHVVAHVDPVHSLFSQAERNDDWSPLARSPA